MATIYELWRDAAYFDDEPVFMEDFQTEKEAKDELVRKARFADLLCSDYEIREISQ